MQKTTAVLFVGCILWKQLWQQKCCLLRCLLSWILGNKMLFITYFFLESLFTKSNNRLFGSACVILNATDYQVTSSQGRPFFARQCYIFVHHVHGANYILLPYKLHTVITSIINHLCLSICSLGPVFALFVPPQHSCWLELDAHGAAPCCTAARCTRECYQDCSDVRGWGEFNWMGSLFLGYSSLGRAVLCQTCANSALGWRVSSYSKGLRSVGGREKVSLHSLKWGLIMSCLQVCQPPH